MDRQRFKKILRIILFVDEVTTIPRLIILGGTIVTTAFAHIFNAIRSLPLAYEILLGIGILLLWFAGVLAIVRWLRRRKQPKIDTLNWCTEILNSDRKELAKRLYKKDLQWLTNELNESDSAIGLILPLINASIFPVLIVGVKGRFKIDGKKCGQVAEMEGKSRIPHGESGNLRITQQLSPIKASILREGRTKISLDLLQLTVQPEIGSDIKSSGPSIDITVGGEYDVGSPSP